MKVDDDAIRTDQELGSRCATNWATQLAKEAEGAASRRALLGAAKLPVEFQRRVALLAMAELMKQHWATEQPTEAGILAALYANVQSDGAEEVTKYLLKDANLLVKVLLNQNTIEAHWRAAPSVKKLEPFWLERLGNNERFVSSFVSMYTKNAVPTWAAYSLLQQERRYHEMAEMLGRDADWTRIFTVVALATKNGMTADERLILQRPVIIRKPFFLSFGIQMLLSDHNKWSNEMLSARDSLAAGKAGFDVVFNAFGVTARISGAIAEETGCSIRTVRWDDGMWEQPMGSNAAKPTIDATRLLFRREPKPTRRLCINRISREYSEKSYEDLGLYAHVPEGTLYQDLRERRVYYAPKEGPGIVESLEDVEGDIFYANGYLFKVDDTRNKKTTDYDQSDLYRLSLRAPNKHWERLPSPPPFTTQIAITQNGSVVAMSPWASWAIVSPTEIHLLAEP